MLSSGKDVLFPEGVVPVTNRIVSGAGLRRLAAPRVETGVVRVFATLVALTALFLAFAAQARGAPDSFAELAERLTPAVVSISTAQTARQGQMPQFMPQVPPGSPFEDLFRDFFERRKRDDDQQPQRRRVTSLGSGFIIDAAGYVVTNNHVIADADEITVVLHDDRQFPAELVGRDPKTDLALLTIETDDALPFVTFGDSDAVRVGDWVVAIGNPFGLGNSVTAGILSARGRDINAGPYDDFLQTDAPINKGNSGGPLFNMDGKVIGVNTAIFSPSGGSVGIGFAVPTALAEPVIKQLRDYGRTRRGWLGVRIQTVTDDIAESLGLDSAHGALVADVTPDSPAEAAGIETGDVILEFNNRAIPEMRELPRVVAATDIGGAVNVVVMRKGRTLTLQVEIGELEEAEPMLAALTQEEEEGSEADSLGMTLSTMTSELRERFSFDEKAQGVVVVEVDPEGTAADRGVRPGDMILEVGLEEVHTPADVVAKVKAADEAKRKSVLLLLDRSSDQRFIAVEIHRD